MNLVKSPYQILLEQAGLPQDIISGFTHTPQQMMPQYSSGGGVYQSLSPADMQAAMIVNGQTPQKFAAGNAVTADNQFQHIVELAHRDPSIFKKLPSHTLSFLGKLFDRLNPAFQAMAAYDTGERGINAAERAQQGDYRGAAISGLGAIGSGIGMLPGGLPQVLSIPATMGADYLQEHYDETDPHESRFSLKNTKLIK